MSIQETFSPPSPRFYKYAGHGSNRDKDVLAMSWVDQLNDSIGRCEAWGITYASGSWGYTALSTTYSEESDALWPAALEKLRRWVTHYFIHTNRLIKNKPDSSVNEELARRFILEVIPGDKESEKLKLPGLSGAGQGDIKSRTGVFDAWLRNAVGSVEFAPADNPRFCDFLVIDEGSLRSLAALPDETPPLGPVTREERRARSKLFGQAYVWLVDSQAVRRFQGVEDADNYNGWMKLSPSDIQDAWFERVARYESDYWTFERTKIPQGSGDLWYNSR